MKNYDLGTILDGKETFRLLEKQLVTHICVVGSIGEGKSRLLWQLLREHRRNRRGFCLIDPGDLGDDFLADCAREMLMTGDKGLLKKIHLLQLSPFQLARYDPFRFQYPKTIHPEFRETVERSWQHTKVQSLAEVFQRKQNQFDFEGMPRLQRNLTNVFTCLSTMVRGKRLSVADAEVLLNTFHPRHDEVYAKLEPLLPRDIRGDYDVLHGFKRVEDVRRDTESAVNRTRSMFGPLMKAMFGGAGREPTIDLYQIVQRGDYLIVNISRSPFASREQNVGLAGLVIHDLFETMLVTPREKRRPFTLVCDEAHMYAGEDFGESMRTMRKYELGVVVATQDLKSLEKKGVDLAPSIVGIPETLVTFKLKWPEDTEIIARMMRSGDLDHTPLLHEIDRHDGYEWHSVKEFGQSVQQNLSVGKGHTQQESQTNSHQVGSSKGQTIGSAKTTSAHEARGEGLSHAVQDPTGMNGTRSTNKSAGTGTSQTSSNAESNTSTVSDGVSKSMGTSDSTNVTAGAGVTQSESNKLVPLAKVKRESQETGKLKTAVNDQWEKLRAEIANLPTRRALVKTPSIAKAIEIETLEVKDPFMNIEAQIKAVENLKRELYEEHDYYFTPNLAPAEDDARIDLFLREGDADEPMIVDAARNENDDEQDPMA